MECMKQEGADKKDCFKKSYGCVKACVKGGDKEEMDEVLFDDESNDVSI